MADADRTIWRDIVSAVRRTSPGVCRHWFSDLSLSSIHQGVIEVLTPTAAQAEYLRSQCAAPFTAAAMDVTGRLLAVRFVTTPTPRNALNAEPAGPETGGAIDELSVSPDYTFESFVVGPNNRLAHAAALAIADSPGRAYNPLFIHGGVGLGKTHLLQAICHAIQTREPGARLLYISCEGLITRFIECVRSGRMDDFRHQFRNVDLLVIDDVHFLAKRDRTQDEFFHTFNSLYQTHRQIVLSSDAPPSQIPDLEERLISRFQWGMVAPIEPPAYETRVQIIKNKARVRGEEIGEDVAGFIAARIDSNIRELEGALTKVQMQARLDNTPIDLATAKTALGGHTGNDDSTPVTIEAVVEAVTAYYDVTLANLQSKHRQRSITLPRQVCMYLARQHTRYSLEEIGGYFGGRDHTTVLHAVRKLEKTRRSNTQIDGELRKLESAITE